MPCISYSIRPGNFWTKETTTSEIMSAQADIRRVEALVDTMDSVQDDLQIRQDNMDRIASRQAGIA